MIPDDVKELASSAFQHRLLLTREAELSGITPARVVQEVIDATGVP